MKNTSLILIILIAAIGGGIAFASDSMPIVGDCSDGPRTLDSINEGDVGSDVTVGGRLLELVENDSNTVTSSLASKDYVRLKDSTNTSQLYLHAAGEGRIHKHNLVNECVSMSGEVDVVDGEIVIRQASVVSWR